MRGGRKRNDNKNEKEKSVYVMNIVSSGASNVNKLVYRAKFEMHRKQKSTTIANQKSLFLRDTHILLRWS